jgi:hypothetical protein
MLAHEIKTLSDYKRDSVKRCTAHLNTEHYATRALRNTLTTKRFNDITDRES